MTDRDPALPEDVRRVLEAERRVAPAPPDSKDRVRARLALTLGLPDAGPGGTPPAPPAAAAATSAVSAKLVLSFLAASVLAGGVVATVLPRAPAPAVAPAPVPAPVTSGVPPSRPVPEPVVQPAGPAPEEHLAPLPLPRRRPAPAALPAQEESTARSGLGEERQVLDAARAALARQDVDAALRTLEEHRRTHRTGQLAEEREALTILALARGGRREDARAAAERFRQDYPQSLFLPAVEATLTRAHADP